MRTNVLQMALAVHVGGELSGTISMRSGAPQGSVLGPFYFFFFLNNLPDALEALMLLFAKNGDFPDTEHMSSQCPYYNMRLV